MPASQDRSGPHGKFGSGHRTGKGQISFQSQRKAMPKNPLGTVLGRTSHPRVGDGVLVLLGSRDCLEPTWTLYLLSVNQGKETALGSQVLICTIAGEIWESGQLGAVCSLLRQFKLKMWVSLLKSLLLIEWTVQK